MRKIKTTEGLSIVFGHAGTRGEALTTININIPLDGNKYMEGLNIIDCIKDRSLPVLDPDAINQELSANDLNLIEGFGESGIYSAPTSPAYRQTYKTSFLYGEDDAALGIINIVEGSNNPTYS